VAGWLLHTRPWIARPLTSAAGALSLAVLLAVGCGSTSPLVLHPSGQVQLRGAERKLAPARVACPKPGSLDLPVRIIPMLRGPALRLVSDAFSPPAACRCVGMRLLQHLLDLPSSWGVAHSAFTPATLMYCNSHDAILHTWWLLSWQQLGCCVFCMCLVCMGMLCMWLLHANQLMPQVGLAAHSHSFFNC